MGIAFCKQLFGVVFFEVFGLKGILLTLFLVAYIFLNIVRLYHKRVSNLSEKVFTNKSLYINSGRFKKTLFKSDISNFGYSTKELDDLIYMANLYVIDKEENMYEIFGIEDESLQFIENDIKWFFTFFMNHFNLKVSDLEGS